MFNFLRRCKPSRPELPITRENVLDAIDRAHARANANPRVLTQGAMAKDSRGKNVSTNSCNARCFCSLGLVANELGMDISDHTELYGALYTAGLDSNVANQTYYLNDEDYNGRGLPGINYLKDMADAVRR